MSIGRWAASWAASTRMRPPTAWTRSARSWTGGTTPVTLEAPVTASSATRPAWRASRRSRSSSSSVPSGRARTCTARVPGPPRQVVGVMLEHRWSARWTRRAPSPAIREQVDGVGGVPPEHDRVASGRPRRRCPPPAGPARRRRCWPGTCSRYPGGRSRRGAGTPPPPPSPGAGRASSPRCRGSRTGPDPRRGRGPARRPHHLVPRDRTLLRRPDERARRGPAAWRLFHAASVGSRPLSNRYRGPGHRCRRRAQAWDPVAEGRMAVMHAPNVAHAVVRVRGSRPAGRPLEPYRHHGRGRRRLRQVRRPGPGLAGQSSPAPRDRGLALLPVRVREARAPGRRAGSRLRRRPRTGLAPRPAVRGGHRPGPAPCLAGPRRRRAAARPLRHACSTSCCGGRRRTSTSCCRAPPARPGAGPLPGRRGHGGDRRRRAPASTMPRWAPSRPASTPSR